MLRACCDVDWSMVKMARLVPEKERPDVLQLLAGEYGHIIALYNHLSAMGISGASSFGINSLEAANLMDEAGVIDGKITKLSDIDRFFIAAKVIPTDAKRDQVVRNDKAMVRHQLLEFFIRVAHHRYFQSGEAASVTDAVKMILEALRTPAEARIKDMDTFFSCLQIEEVDSSYRKNLSTLEAVYQRFSGKLVQPGQPRSMSNFEFQELCDTIGAYDGDFQQRHAAIAFRMGMMTQPDECYSSRFQEMTFLEFLYGLGAVVFLRGGYRPDNIAELMEEFLSEMLPRALADAGRTSHLM